MAVIVGQQQQKKNVNMVMVLCVLVVMSSYMVGKAEGRLCFDACWTQCHPDHYWTFCTPYCSGMCLGTPGGQIPDSGSFDDAIMNDSMRSSNKRNKRMKSRKLSPQCALMERLFLS